MTAALVGFFGGVLIIRIQTHRSRWRDGRSALRKQLKKYNALHKNPQNNPQELQNQVERLKDQADDGLNTRFPGELVNFSLFLVVLFAVGIALPLISLPKPENWIRWWLVGAVGFITFAAMAYIFVSAMRALRGYQDECNDAKKLFEE